MLLSLQSYKLIEIHQAFSQKRWEAEKPTSHLHTTKSNHYEKSLTLNISVLNVFIPFQRYKSTNCKSFVKLFFQLFFVTGDKPLFFSVKKIIHYYALVILNVNIPF